MTTSITNKVVSKDGTLIAYDIYGQGPAVVLIDGAFCSRAFGPLAELAQKLVPDLTVVTYDRRGRGQSGDTPPYAVDREIEDIAALIRAVGGSASLYGLSSGAALALEAAIRFQSGADGVNVEKLAMHEPPYMVNAADHHPPMGYAAELAGLAAQNRRGDMVISYMTRTGRPAEVVERVRLSPTWPSFEAVAPTLVYDITIMEAHGWQPPEARTGLRIPVLATDGAESPAWAGRIAQAFVESIPGAQRRTLSGQGHDVSAEVLASALKDFFLE